MSIKDYKRGYLDGHHEGINGRPLPGAVKAMINGVDVWVDIAEDSKMKEKWFRIKCWGCGFESNIGAATGPEETICEILQAIHDRGECRSQLKVINTWDKLKVEWEDEDG